MIPYAIAGAENAIAHPMVTRIIEASGTRPVNIRNPKVATAIQARSDGNDPSSNISIQWVAATIAEVESLIIAENQP